MIINKYKGPSWLEAEFVEAELVRGRLCQGPSLLGTDLSNIPAISRMVQTNFLYMLEKKHI